MAGSLRVCKRRQTLTNARKRRQTQFQALGDLENRSLRNGVRKNGVRNRCPYRRFGVDTEIPYRLFSLILCRGESVEAELVLGAIQAVDAEFPYLDPIVNRGTIAVPLFADPPSVSWRKGPKTQTNGHKRRQA